jgi:hypothetical protein
MPNMKLTMRQASNMVITILHSLPLSMGQKSPIVHHAGSLISVSTDSEYLTSLVLIVEDNEEYCIITLLLL